MTTFEQQLAFFPFPPESYISPKSAFCNRITPNLLDESRKKLFAFSSPKPTVNPLKVSRARPRPVNRPQVKPEPQTTSITCKEIVPEFPEIMYDRIEEFLDEEGLFLVSPSPYNKTAKKGVKLVRFSTNPEIYSSQLKESENAGSKTPLPTMPSILARRTMSAGVTKNVQHKLMRFTTVESLPRVGALEFGETNFGGFDASSNEDISFV